ncbi:DNA polymerase III subunit epsilon [Leuconostoc gelidum subsp. aenigmaticum]|uniref:exonuclease domain-containing protein n=1 Tax=Leuconostoc gelidum TaxID=1244 RepID=UPI001CC66868|nr:exonuclease domain-containing protein [Leuconostoc gelidum]MBZ6008101.1 DNA polymerase III subunit epsilon [Leuconostoc gelidum subsp. aenigmaticum]
MNANETFVVVDLETTGQSVTKGGRIIQIGMTFIKQRQIVDHFESFVNPGQLIDRNIQQLTHIAQKDVKNAPYFEELAPMLQNLLNNTIIIAHNVNFDYPYLNDEFKRTGFPELTSSAIDTVQLAQILLPTAPGYRLLDLTTYLDITLNNAHRANADAHATALLFLKLWQRAEQLPAIVLKQLQDGQWPFLRQTQTFLKLIQAKGQREDIKLSKNIAIRKPLQATISSSQQNYPKYPTSTQEKAHIFGHWLTANDAQNSLMNRVNEFIVKRSDGILTVLTAPKIGKTLGYLVPLLLDAKSRPVVLLTNDSSLQIQQLTLVQKLTKLLNIKLNTAILYDPAEYIDLDRFVDVLNRSTDASQTQFFKARILVWLTQTKTGLLREIQVGTQNIDMLSDIRGDTESQYFKQAQVNANVSDVIIMNFESYFNQEQYLRVTRKIEKWLVVVMETPSQFVTNLQNYFHVDLNLTQVQNVFKNLSHQEIVGLSHKQRVFIKQSLSEALKLIKQINHTDNKVPNLKRIERLLTIMAHLTDIIKIGGTQVPCELIQGKGQLIKVKRLQQQSDVISSVEIQNINEQQQVVVSFDVLDRRIYQEKFIVHIQKLLIVSEYLDNQVSEFLRDAPKNITVERDFIHNKAIPVRIIQMQKSSPIVHLQAITQQNVGEILLILPDIERVNHWYQKIKRTVTTQYNIVAESITGSLEKIQRQSHPEQTNIVIVTAKIFSTMWLRDQEVPAVVIVPERLVWQPVSRLALVLTQMQKHQAPLLITQLNAMQRNRFKAQIKVVSHFDVKNNLIQQYSQILKDV